MNKKKRQVLKRRTWCLLYPCLAGDAMIGGPGNLAVFSSKKEAESWATA